jgi:hypothetical protein
MIRKSCTYFTYSLLALLLWVAAVAAQDPAPAFNSELARLDRLLESARQALGVYQSKEARDLLTQAENLRKDIDLRISQRRFREAQMLIREAIVFAERAIKLTLDLPVSRLRAQLEEVLRRAETEVLNSGNREALRLLQEAKRNRDQGDQSARVQSLNAIEHYQIGIALAERALKLVAGRTSSFSSPVDVLDRAKEYYSSLEAQARESLRDCQNAIAQRLYNQAQKQIQAAQESSRRGEYVLAQQFYNGATRLLLRAIDLCRPQLAQQDAGTLKKNLQALRESIDTAEEELSRRDDPRGRALLDWALRLASEAEAALSAQQPVRAALRLERARFLVERARRNATSAPVDFKQQCESELRQLLADLNEVDEEIKAAENPEAQSLVELARKAHGEAERVCNRATNSLAALAAFRMMLRMGHQFLLQAESLSQDGGSADINRNVVQQRLKELDATIIEVRSNVQREQTGFAQILVMQAAGLRDRAQAAYQRGYFVVAMETSGMALDLLREALKLGR